MKVFRRIVCVFVTLAITISSYADFQARQKKTIIIANGTVEDLAFVCEELKKNGIFSFRHGSVYYCAEVKDEDYFRALRVLYRTQRGTRIREDTLELEASFSGGPITAYNRHGKVWVD